MSVSIIENIAIEVVRRRVLTRCGYGKGAEILPADAQLIESEFPKMMALAEPKIAIADCDVVVVKPDRIVIEGEIEIPGPRLAKYLAGARRVSLYAATIGPAVEQMSTALSESGKVRAAFMWDCFGSEAAEATARRVSLIAHQRAKLAGLTNTVRFSPGYIDIPLRVNEVILKLVEGDRIGVSVNEAGLLTPRKSTTGIIGWIPPRT